MICNNIRNDIGHINEYIVTLTLKLVSKLGTKELIDSIITILLDKCINHIDINVRWNAIECLFEIYKKFGLKI